MDDSPTLIPLEVYLGPRSSWPRRLLGLEPYQCDRSSQAVHEEYDQARYEALRPRTGEGIEDVKVREFASLGMGMQEPHYYSVGEEIWRAPLEVARRPWYELLRSTVAPFASGRVCELGCGYGYNFSLWRGAGAGEVYGGDFSQHAVRIGQELGLDIRAFDYYRAEDYQLIRPESTVVTVHSVEQLPSAIPFLDGLATVRDRIDTVVQIEPTFLASRSSFLGLIRNRYNRLIDHNHDLLAQLEGRPEIELLEVRADVYGMHPLNSSNVFVWRFRR